MALKKSVKYEIYAWLWFIVITFLLAAILDRFYNVNFFEVAKTVFGVVYVLFIPGYVVVKCFFNELDWVEKIAVSFGLSIAVVVLAVIIANLVFKIPITPLSNVVIILVAILITLFAKYYSTTNQWMKTKKLCIKKKNRFVRKLKKIFGIERKKQKI